MAVWLVRAGVNGENEALAVDSNQAIIDFRTFPDLSQFRSKEEVTNFSRIHHAEDSEARIRNRVSQVWAFSHRINTGDLIALPAKGRNKISFGICTGPYEYRESNPLGSRHVIPVRWDWPDVPKDMIGQDILFSLGAFMTVCQIKRNNAEFRLREMLSSEVRDTTPSGYEISPNETETSPATSEDDAETAEMIPNIESYANTQIQAYVREKFEGHRLSLLIAAILKAQGFETFVSPAGPDGGIDIIAGKGPMGFEAPRLVVQVKNTIEPQNIQVIRELQGTMHGLNADHGLFVSWSGFRRSVHAEIRRNYFQVRLWDSADILNNINEYYDQFSEEIRADLPLKKIFMLVPEHDE